jgi:hypothetical protein
VWNPIEWDGDCNPDYFDELAILIGGAKFSASLTCKITGRGGAVVDTSWVEVESGDVKETYATSVCGPYDSVADTRNGFVQKGRRLRARVRVRNGDATLERADVTLLIFR